MSWKNRTFATAGRKGHYFFLPPLSLLFHIYFSASRFSSAFNQGQYVLNQHFSFFMQHCPLKLFAAGWQLNCCQYPLRAPPMVCTSVAFPELSKYPGGNLTCSMSESAYQAGLYSGLSASRRLTLRKQWGPHGSHQSYQNSVVNQGVFWTNKENSFI